MKRKVARSVLAGAMALAAAGTGSAKITPVCQNPSGGEPQGKCQGQALTKENRNPAGKAPAGQNK